MLNLILAIAVIAALSSVALLGFVLTQERREQKRRNKKYWEGL